MYYSIARCDMTGGGFSKLVKSTLKRLGLTEDAIKKLSELNDISNQLLEVRTTMLAYDYCRDDLAKSATKLNNAYEYFINLPDDPMGKYFKERYDSWTCLVLMTEDRVVHDYTKRNFVMAFRGMDTHNQPPSNPKIKYLADFVRGKNNPTILFFENYRRSQYIFSDAESRHEMSREHEIRFNVDLKLDLKDSIFFNIFADLWTSTAMTKTPTRVGRTIIDNYPHDLLHTHAPELVDKIKKQHAILREVNVASAADQTEG